MMVEGADFVLACIEIVELTAFMLFMRHVSQVDSVAVWKSAFVSQVVEAHIWCPGLVIWHPV